ncbi:YdeI/OmpD-associated family protein [Pedobacter jejuensis]|uniref:YdhG-like domain-containing protein n=1 Tax=Pedobacter jejuensis TaxID=1268550 RepID=A0A3N0BXM7_9SPHI|nr:YdeI/OmpD-associated family protein [Pedobacter jejuensis]RNL54085.1 hypothetical protein D7004_08265 [Pedobacter jejuensis]
MNTTAAVDQYISNSKEFAIPILEHLRKLIHQADTRIEEKIKWSMPFFEYKGTVCHFAAFKNHCVMGFWKASLMNDDYHIFQKSSDAMGWLGEIKSFADLPDDDIIIAYVQQAIELNEAGIKLPTKEKSASKELEVPQYFIDALQEDPAAMATFQNFSYSNKKEYVEWLLDAKTEATRLKRLDTAVEWISEGKTRMWKYKK